MASGRTFGHEHGSGDTLAALFIYSAWLTSIVFCSAHDERPLLIAAAAFFPVGVVHGIGVWFGGW